MISTAIAIGLGAGPRQPTLAALRAIVAGHTAAIPFENFDVLAKRPIVLDQPSLHEKLVRHRRAGYCYEHNLLLLDLLLALGFLRRVWQRESIAAGRPE